MPNKTLYIGPRQADTWTAAEQVANEEGISLGSLVHRALRRELAHIASVNAPTGGATPTTFKINPPTSSLPPDLRGAL